MPFSHLRQIKRRGKYQGHVQHFGDIVETRYQSAHRGYQDWPLFAQFLEERQGLGVDPAANERISVRSCGRVKLLQVVGWSWGR